MLSAHNIAELGPKAIAKRAAKETAKAVVAGRQLDSSVDENDSLGQLEGRHTLEITELPDSETTDKSEAKT